MKYTPRDYWPVDRCKPHPENERIYGDEIPDEFIEMVRANGITADIQVLPDGVILGGHRRWRAAKAVGIEKVPVRIRYDLVNDKVGQLMLLAVDNEYREETNEQKLRRYKLIKECEAAKAEKRQNAGLNRGQIPVRPKVDAREKLQEKGRSDEKAAKTVGMGKMTARRGAQVIDAIDKAAESGDDEKAEELRETLNKKSVSAASKKLTKGVEMKEEETKDDIRERAKRHLKTWTKAQLIEQLANSAKDGWLKKWADES